MKTPVFLAAVALVACSAVLPDATHTTKKGEPNSTPATVAQSPSVARMETIRARPVRPGAADRFEWRRRGCEVVADAPPGAVGYSVGGLVRVVYHDGPFAGLLRVGQSCSCGWGIDVTIVVEFADGERVSWVVPAVKCEVIE